MINIPSLYGRFCSDETHITCAGRIAACQEWRKGSRPARRRVAARILRAVYAMCFLVLISLGRCYSADVVFIGAGGEASDEQQKVELATRFYGLNLDVVTVGAGNIEPALKTLVERRDTVAVAIAANALALVKEETLLRVLHRGPERSVPLFILGVTPETDAALLKAWSGGAVVGCKRMIGPRDSRYIIRRFEGVTRQISNMEVSIPAIDAVYFLLGENNRAQQIMMVQADGGTFPIFIATDLDQVKVFVSCKKPSLGTAAGEWDSANMVRAFTEIAPEMMVIRYSAGERGWHSLQHYANLTIDDPWLRESYGYLDYRRLLAEMETHNFHSTIAFIPWNYDRSQPEVVSLFRNHTDRLSICIHGDNHDHKEFTDFRSKDLATQIAGLKQALARMDGFQALTGISYDKVMVFPHSIAPEKTLEALKIYNYQATVNSSNVPMDRPGPPFRPFAFRPVTVEYANFASIRRYPVELPAPTSFIAINEFLDNPLFFYCHHDFFSSGIDAFDGVADQVNRLESNTRWRSVGEIVRHLYLVKLRDDNSYDVLSFSSDVRLENISGRDSIFYLRKQEAGGTVIRSVSIDGQKYPYRLRDGYLDLSVPIPAGQARAVVIQYENDLNSTAIDVSKTSVRVYLLRMASDIRDISLPRHAAGRALIALYYEDGIKRSWTLVYLSGLVALCVWVAFRLLKMIGSSSRMGRTGPHT